MRSSQMGKKWKREQKKTSIHCHDIGNSILIKLLDTEVSNVWINLKINLSTRNTTNIKTKR